MEQTKMRMIAALLMFAATGAGTLAYAQAGRDPAYAAARAAGQIGEKPDGYLAIVGASTPALEKIVNDINIQRKAAYTKSAAASATVEQFAFVAGCNLILKTVPGEKYMTPDGKWMTRTNDAPIRDSRCV